MTPQLMKELMPKPKLAWYANDDDTVTLVFTCGDRNRTTRKKTMTTEEAHRTWTKVRDTLLTSCAEVLECLK